MMAYSVCMEQEVEQLRSFQLWAIRKITSQEIEMIAVRRWLEEIVDTIAP